MVKKLQFGKPQKKIESIMKKPTTLYLGTLDENLVFNPFTSLKNTFPANTIAYENRMYKEVNSEGHWYILQSEYNLLPKEVKREGLQI